ncbi:hypothetical protein, partial [Nocardioides albus]|uniref:hypothetical protein n=2 Tax=Nocardioides albus TaxID=1841 RepID=UPI001E402B2B
PVLSHPVPRHSHHAMPAPATPPIPEDLPPGTSVKKLASNGALKLGRVTYMVGGQHGFQHVLVITDGDATGDKITVADLQGEILIEHTRPAPEVTYVGNGRPRGPRPNNPEPSPKS